MNRVADEQPPAAPSVSAPREALEEPEVIQAVQEYQAALGAGACPDRGALLARFRATAPALAECLDGLEFVQAAARGLSWQGSPRTEVSPEGPPPWTEPLGDFRIVRELGRGGMGVVYEAEQISLGRRVALKVLALAATLDSKQLHRFKNEAQAAAGLQHQNIVPVYAVGCERGVHYYAMQFVDGQTLAGLIEDLRFSILDLQKQPREAGEPSPPHDARSGSSVLRVAAIENQKSNIENSTAVALTTEHSIKNPEFFHTVARLGIQAAEALEHAHSMGVVHRDIKPANLLVDVRGNLWITDFGLARLPTDVGLTLSSDVLGTLRYMSPEQALAKHGLVDHRTDIYSLGVTLYEILTLRPVFDGRDRQELLQKIASEEPRLPSALNPALPTELETIVLKAMAKEPEGRYPAAQELADDLRRFLDNRPILAKRPTLLQRARKWARRHRSFVLAAVIMLIVAVIGLALSTWLIWRAEQRTEAALHDAQTERERAELRAQETLEAVDRILDAGRL